MERSLLRHRILPGLLEGKVPTGPNDRSGAGIPKDPTNSGRLFTFPAKISPIEREALRRGESQTRRMEKKKGSFPGEAIFGLLCLAFAFIFFVFVVYLFD
jgi:hypothetical protein